MVFVKMFGPVLGDLKNARKRRERLFVDFVNNCQQAPYPAGRSCDFEGGVPGEPEKGYSSSDFDEAKGKPMPGSDPWLDAHNISREVFLDRPYHRFEQGSTFDDLPANIQALYNDEPEAARQLNKIMRQEGGFIMVRTAVPGSPEKGVVPQTRPDFPIVTDQGKRARAARQLENSRVRAEDIKSRGASGIVELQKERVEKSKTRLEEAKVITRESYLAYANGRIAEAEATKVAAQDAYLAATGTNSTRAANAVARTGGSEEVMAAKDAYEESQKGATKSKRTLDSMTKQADMDFGPNGEHTERVRAVMTENATKILAQAEKKLVKYEAATPEQREEYFKKEGENADEFVRKAENAYDKTAVKYVFPPNPSRLRAEIENGEVLGKAGRVNAHMDENVDRLVNGKGRVYLAMEGCMKEDSLLTAVKQEEDPTSAVISVPSVTLWRNKDMMAIAKGHLEGREVVLIPDADGVNNPRVQNEARAMQSMLEGLGARVVVAPPPIPLIDGKPIVNPKDDSKVLLFEEKVKGSPKGYVEELKGVDDYLGVGRDHDEAKGTLGNLAVQNRTVPKIDLKDTSQSIHGDMGTGIMTQAIPNAEKALGALSNILGPVGAGHVGTEMLSAAMGDFTSNRKQAQRALGHLEDDGHIKIEYLYDADAMKMGKRVMHPNMTEDRVDQLVKAGVIDRPAYEADDTQPVDLSYEETPIITIHKKYRATDSAPTPLSDRPSTKMNITKTRIKSLQSGGKTLEDIADLLGVSKSYLSSVLK